MGIKFVSARAGRIARINGAWITIITVQRSAETETADAIVHRAGVAVVTCRRRGARAVDRTVTPVLAGLAPSVTAARTRTTRRIARPTVRGAHRIATVDRILAARPTGRTTATESAAALAALLAAAVLRAGTGGAILARIANAIATERRRATQAIGRTQIAILAGLADLVPAARLRSRGNTPQGRITEINRASVAVVAEPIGRHVHTGARGLSAGVHGTRYAVVAVDRQARTTRTIDAGLRTITRQAIVTFGGCNAARSARRTVGARRPGIKWHIQHRGQYIAESGRIGVIA